MVEPQLATANDPQQPLVVEWPTLLVAAGCWGGFITLLAVHDRLPDVVVVLAFALLGGWYMSLQHEVIHGHPTPSGLCNSMLVVAPLSLWLPYRLYRDSHLVHHRVELTAPGIDPESFYVSTEQWDAAPGPIRLLWRANRTMIGRLLIGPALGPPMKVVADLRRSRHDAERARMWIVHLIAATAVGWVVFGVAGVPVWQYLLGYVYLGMSVTYIRSFVEHVAVPAPATRSAMVRSNWFFGLLFLNNNLHHTHHSLPGAAWYRLPRLTDEMAAIEAAGQGAGSYRGYGEVMRRFAVRPFCSVVDPLSDLAAR